jgi:hypothetical protein
MKSELLLSLPPNMCASLTECDPGLADGCSLLDIQRKYPELIQHFMVGSC